MLALLLVVLALTEFGSSITIDDCPAGVTKDQYLQVFEDSCFEFVLYRKREYDTAIQECRLNGGLLALVKTPEIQNYIYNELINTYNTKARVWIGLTDKGSENDWVWEDGEAMKYNNWADGQGPNYSAVSHLLEDCTVLDASVGGKWHDYDCTNELFGWIKYENNFVCQYKVQPSTARPITRSTSKVPAVSTNARPATTSRLISTLAARQTSACPPFTCELDCGLTGYLKNPANGCSLCQCDV